MECKKCGATVVDEAIFCQNCGARADGKISCKSCGRLNAEGGAYCIFCGARIDGKSVCRHCGTVHEGGFCPTCGKGPEKGTASQAPHALQGSFGAASNACKIIHGAAMALGVLFALIFVFFIGVEVVVKDTAFLSLGLESDSIHIFYFFGEYYEDVEALKIGELQTSTWFKELIETQTTAYGVIGTVLGALSIASVWTFGVIALVQYALGWTKKETDKGTTCALLCVLSFLVGAIAFYGVNYQAATGIKTKYNGATAAAIVLTILCCAIGVLAKGFAGGKQVWNKKRLPLQITAVIGAVLSTAALCIAKNVALYFDCDLSSLASGLGSMELASGFSCFNPGFDLIFAVTLDSSAEKYREITTAIETMNVSNLVAQICALGFVACVGASLYSSLRGIEKEKADVVFPILSLLFAVGVLVASIISYNAVGEIAKLMDAPKNTLDGKLGVAICAVVFSALLLAGAIVRLLFIRRKKSV